MSETVQTKNQTSVMQTYSRFPLTLTKGKGSYVWDDQGQKYLDFTSGIATCNLGHVPDVIKNKVNEQLDQLWHCSNLYTIPSQEKLAQLLTDNSCADQVFFCNSGAEANEAAIKIARKYAQDVKGTSKYEVVTFSNSFHGRTLATLSATGQEKIQQGFAPLTPGFRYLPFNDFDALEDLVQEQTCAVMLELVQGEGGVVPADQAWLDKLGELCKNYDLLLMVDEIQTGVGRTGTLFAYEQFGIEPDVFTLAKGLGSGVAIGAMLAKEPVAQAFVPGSHGSTFGGNPIATTAAAATIEYMTESSILEQSNEVASYLHQALHKLVEKYDSIEQVRGKGLLVGLVVKGNAIDYVTKAREDQNLLILVAGPKVVRILPPLTATKAEVDQCIQSLEVVFQES
ncbi:acetylornithine transaminase [Aquibacillus koreensis]|uniref:Acetylornithine aminotransferase n=1 Tax=Aquibacillus koreensis TaxID=279446 RepID=A0A9X3WMI3_9BACI|nr:acetylornithine transaminase [Aquibacillus koreensis]MCT2538135.1 acetylornithine transaminase [Aquibacillus koreensis]MDC3420921.1 acetylornithine transaminase [Aquibacillus koreensis]